MKYLNVMIDIETMSTKSNAAITSIGAVTMDFEKGELGKSVFYVPVDLRTSVEKNGHLCADTVLWWLTQSKEAIEGMINDVTPLDVALHELSLWLNSHVADGYRIWSNGANFDGVILREAYSNCGMESPWNFRSEMCYRTMRIMNKHIEAVQLNGVSHNALDDAKYQAMHLIRIMEAANDA